MENKKRQERKRGNSEQLPLIPPIIIANWISSKIILCKHTAQEKLHAVTLKNIELDSVLGKSTEFKTGLVLNKNEIINLFLEDTAFRILLSVSDESYIRVYPDDVNEMFPIFCIALVVLKHRSATHKTGLTLKQ